MPCCDRFAAVESPRALQVKGAQVEGPRALQVEGPRAMQMQALRCYSLTA